VTAGKTRAQKCSIGGGSNYIRRCNVTPTYNSSFYPLILPLCDSFRLVVSVVYSLKMAFLNALAGYKSGPKEFEHFERDRT